MTVRWLHLSDIHERKRDEFFRKLMYGRIITEVKENAPPDAVFLTGDMAFSGMNAEYRSLEEAFVTPLRAALPAGCPIFTIPGNHDVDRTRGSNPRTWFKEPGEAALFQKLDDAGAQFRKDKLFPRFEAYAEFEQRVSVWGGLHWLESDRGAICRSLAVNGTKVAIVGVNTAWLCNDDDDAGKLTPGRYMLEAVLDEAAATHPDLLIVLGHHPLDALIAGADDSDSRRVRTLLKRHNALYLHGDLHAGDSERFGDDANNALTIQAPAAFQAVDSRRWRNGLMWGEADVQSGWVMVEPKVWNDDHDEFKFNGDAGLNKYRFKFGDSDVFRLRLPGHAAGPILDDGVVLPPGWIKRNHEDVQKIRAQPPSAGMMANFFDGEFPSWELALAAGIKPRTIAEQLATNLRTARAAANRPYVALVLSAGGEGKSTALIHAAASLLEDKQQRWTCLYRQATMQPLPENWLAQLPHKENHSWVVVIDEADNIARTILTEVERIAGRGDIHLLLAARNAEWQTKKIGRAWDKFCTYLEQEIQGLSETDAKSIVSAWRHWDFKTAATGQGDEEITVAELLRHARDVAARNEAGELLGALLLTRHGVHLKPHVARMIEGLDQKLRIGKRKHSLRYIYAMIAAMHAENQLYLSVPVLAQALDCEPEELNQKALRVLRQETRLLDAGETYVLTRHRVIAEAACNVLREDQTLNFDALYPHLARSARKLYLLKSEIMRNDIANWNYSLTARFLEKGQRSWPVAQAVARALHEADPGNGYLLTGYCKVLRNTKDIPAAMAALKAGAENVVDRDRVFFYEWSTIAGLADNHELSVWLAGRSLADGERGDVDAKRCELSLVGLSVAFGELNRGSKNKVLAKAQAACGQLGLLLPQISEQSRSALEKAESAGRRNGIATLSPDESRKAIHDGVVVGSDDIDLAEGQYFENLIGEPRGYKYSAMLNQTAGKLGKI